jgi:CubicO group peptidase (beta-lactamase class C family)
MKTIRPAVAALVLLLSVLTPAAAQDRTVRVDAVFADYAAPAMAGCAVGVDENGMTTLARAYGIADLEHDIRNTPETIFEAGSVSKQFTATAIILLAIDGKLSLDDDVRKYVPELPDYGQTITIRHLMNHTSGLRDWGSVAGIAGWPRGRRAHTHDHVIDILSRQRGVNFPPGHEYSYSNSGYNLQAIIVDRVSGMSFAEFSKQRVFEPAGMTNTQWRDDFTRIVKNRAVGYSGGRGGTLRIDMPYENVHGNGGLLSTVGDLLLWNRHLETGGPFGQDWREEMHRQGILTNGDTIAYASGLFVGDHRDIPEVSHTGATAGYRAFLARYPEQKLSIAVLCNIGSANPGGLGHAVADVWLPQPAVAQASVGGRGGGQGSRGGRGGQPAFTLTPAKLAEYAGEYYSTDAELTLRLVVEDGRLYALRRPADRLAMTPSGQDEFNALSLGGITFHRNASGRIIDFGLRQGRVYDLRFDRCDEVGRLCRLR